MHVHLFTCICIDLMEAGMKHPLMKLDDIPESGTAVVPFFGRDVHVYRSQGRPRAAANVPPHENVSVWLAIDPWILVSLTTD